ncbi:DEAD/DEAH box helicase [Halegenticoccus soli]|uniref:DEAD/DEAH box helicase n=1 Tax=Halegenticoccus soli TaxID=1985678 RepID=UPI001E462AB5|nr:DEAD/DEAH box helicase [Halegenticoccus soli]
MRLRFEWGSIEAEKPTEPPVNGERCSTPDGTVPGLYYRDVRDALRAAGVEYRDAVLDPIPSPGLSCDLDLRPYQREALDRWTATKRGAVVLPTGAGKTYVGMAAIDATDAPTLVVVPTLDLVDQWRRELRVFGVPVGEYTGRRKDLRALTVTTYDSAYARAGTLGNRFELVVFDEVHHLAAERYGRIAERFASPYRLGLTATYEREDDGHVRLGPLLGGRVYEIDTDDLVGTYLSEYTVERITVDLTPDEREAYEEHAEAFRNYLRFSNVTLRGPNDFKKIVLRSGNDPRAWRAVRGRNEARKIAYNAESKLDELAVLLADCRGERGGPDERSARGDRNERDGRGDGNERDGQSDRDELAGRTPASSATDRVIIFTRYNDLVHRVSDRFLIPAITHRTDRAERREILDRFRDGTYSAVVSSQVLDEGVDVPDANVGIVLSGTGSSREYRQRLGRILRPSERPARLYELVSNDTSEVQTAARRRS